MNQSRHHSATFPCRSYSPQAFGACWATLPAVGGRSAVVLSRLVGFHWALLPALALELIPFVDLAPTWVACVAYVIAQRKREGRYVE